MAIEYDKSGQGQGTTSGSVSLAAATTGETAVFFVVYAFANTTLGNVTVNGSTTGVTQIGSEFTNADNTWKMRAYYFNNASTSSVAYAVAGSGADPAVKILVSLFRGVGSTQPDSSGTGTGVLNVTLSTTVVAANCWLVSAAIQRGVSGQPTGGTGTTSRTGNGTDWAIGDSNAIVGTGSQSMAWNGGGVTTSIGGIIISISPGSASVNSGFFNFMPN